MSDPVEQVKEAFKVSNVVLLTGPGGTGKTHTINKICETEKNVARTATTGIAATHINGDTIHRFSGIGMYNNMDAYGLITKGRGFAQKREKIQSADLIIIDEISMMHRLQADLISKVFGFACRKKKEPFGGKRILLSGDFLQLPPVSKNEGEAMDPWVFQSDAWRKSFVQVVSLTKVWRQSDTEFLAALHEIRKGRCGDVENEMIAARAGAQLEHEPVKFVSTNSEAEKINMTELERLGGKCYSSQADVQVYDAVSEAQEKFLKDQIIKDTIAPVVLRLKVGCQVMILKNGDGYCNGTMGTVKEVASGTIKVEDYDGKVHYLERAEWTKLDEKNKVVARFTQYPVKLAYAITIHKSQGMTIDCCEIDFKRFFAPGQAYVALSRVRSLDGLRVVNWDRSCVFADQAAIDFYESLGAL